MLTDSTRRHLKLLANLVFIAIAVALFILNIIRYVRVYVSRGEYEIFDQVLIIPLGANVTTIFDDCSSKNYSPSNALTIYQWFVDSNTDKNRLFHAFFWWMMIFSLIISVVPSLFYVIRYFQSNRYNVVERFWISRSQHFVRTFFSTAIFIFPSFFMNTFDFDDKFCLKTSPLNTIVSTFPYIFVSMIGLTIYFLLYAIVHQFYAKHRFCCDSECVSYCALYCLTFLMSGIIVFSAIFIFYIWIVSFVEESLRLAAILVIVQMPFLPVQVLID